MKLPRAFSLVDVGIAALVLVAIFLPARTMYAASAVKGDKQARFALAVAEARAEASPQDGALTADLTRRLSAAGFKDWAIEVAVDGSDKMKGSPSRWQALFAASAAYTDRVDIKEAVDYANRAVSACEGAGPVACPEWQAVPLDLYLQHLQAGVASGIDPHRDPDGFRGAGENAIRVIRTKSVTTERTPGTPAGSPPPAPAPSPVPAP